MAIVGFNFNKMHVERKGPIKGKVNIKNNISIKAIEKTNLALGSAKQDGLRFTFEFVTNYEPKVAEIFITGEVFDLQPEKKVEEVVKEWKKDKKIDTIIMTHVLNTVLSKCNVQALLLSKDMNLPPHIPLPKVGSRQAGQASTQV
ncbi:hypothetical protein HY488_01445 [Candidatus Woesearchaeota archaeon]|nr:hypothetical protein [Candidatus Woesearchaeota archaeon]